MSEFRFCRNGQIKSFQICDNGGFRVQVGKHDKLGHPRYKTIKRMEGVASLNDAWRLFCSIKVECGYTVRLSYNTSRNAPYYELYKVRG